VLLLFTDGLVEGRNQPVEDGMHVLRGAVSDVRGTDASDVEALCDELLRAMGRDGRPDDDSALLAVWTGPTAGAGAGDTDVHLHLAGHLSEVARARRLTVQVAEGLGVDLDDAALLVTEVATNALRHGGPGVDLWLRSGGGRRPAGRDRGRPGRVAAASADAGRRRRGRAGAAAGERAGPLVGQRAAVRRQVRVVRAGASAGRLTAEARFELAPRWPADCRA
jgi:hypothetical protein